jgi:hypothetical protein
MAVEASNRAESSVRLEMVKSDMINLRPLRDPVGRANPLDARGSASILAVIMALAKGFARDGIGASLLGFEIFVRWTS